MDLWVGWSCPVGGFVGEFVSWLVMPGSRAGGFGSCLVGLGSRFGWFIGGFVGTAGKVVGALLAGRTVDESKVDYVRTVEGDTAGDTVGDILAA